MSRIILYIAASLDGYIARPDGSVAWLDPFNNANYGYEKFYESVGSLVMGSKTYEFVLNYGKWPYGGKKTFVATKRTMPLFSEGDIELTFDPPKELAEKARKAAHDKDVWLIGGGGLTATFLNEGLLDEIILFHMPLVLGEGIPLFKPIPKTISLRLLESKDYPNGVVETRYAIA